MKKLFFIFAIGVGVLGFAQKKNSQDWHKKEILEKDRFSKDFDRMINFEKGKLFLLRKGGFFSEKCKFRE